MTKTVWTGFYGIHDYIAGIDVSAAERFLRDLADKIAWVAETGFTGSPRDHGKTGDGLHHFRSLADEPHGSGWQFYALTNRHTPYAPDDRLP